MPAETPIQLRRGAKATWSSVNPTLLAGEVGFESDTGAIKVGDGTTAWNSLAFPSDGLGDIRLLNGSGGYFSGSGLVLSGLLNQYAQTPDTAALSITGDIDIKVKVKLVDWTPAATQTLVSKWGSSVQSYRLYVATDGTLNLNTSTTGANSVLGTSTVATGITDDTTKWVRATLDVNDGAGNRVHKFYTSDDGTTWTQLGTTVTTVGTTSIFNSTAVLTVGAEASPANPVKGTIYRTIIQSAFDTGDNTTSVAFDADFASVALDSLAFTESSSNAATVRLVSTRYTYGIPNERFRTTLTSTFTANITYFALFQITTPILVDALFLEVSTATSGAVTLKTAVYSANTNGQAVGAPIIDFGSISLAFGDIGIYQKQITPVTLKPGNYLAAANSSFAVTLRHFEGGLQFARSTGTASPYQRFYVSETNSSFPSTGPAWDTVSTGPYSFPFLLRWFPL